MKTTIKLFRVLAILVGMLVYSGCSESSDPVPPNEVQLDKLSKTWKIISVKLDGVDETAYYPNFGLLINGTNPTSFTYTASNRPHYSPWPASGTLTFGATVESTLIRDKGTTSALTMTYVVTDTKLEMHFTFNGDPYNARTASVGGQWVFSFGL